jgi:CheY-like chemotaxis protein
MTQQTISTTSARRDTILVVDDNPDVCRLMRIVLSKKYNLLEASSATAALELTTRHQPQLVLLDIMMTGEMDGLKVLDAIKSDPALKDVIVGMVTACGQDADRLDARIRGANAYFVKPFSPLEVVTWVNSQLQ